MYAFGAVFISCELCQKVSDGCEEFNDQIGQFKWYSFPIGIKRILPIIMIHTQQPTVFECFGSIICNRDTFKQVRYSIVPNILEKIQIHGTWGRINGLIVLFFRLSMVDCHTL